LNEHFQDRDFTSGESAGDFSLQVGKSERHGPAAATIRRRRRPAIVLFGHRQADGPIGCSEWAIQIIQNSIRRLLLWAHRSLYRMILLLIYM